CLATRLPGDPAAWRPRCLATPLPGDPAAWRPRCLATPLPGDPAAWRHCHGCQPSRRSTLVSLSHINPVTG
ncbi:MAG TPA: hypothetical protein VLM11_04050, partial [Streptosporangiaceae bacterium]|nr:hypothetical protein [Streptosporangiaceae bacterium]